MTELTILLVGILLKSFHDSGNQVKIFSIAKIILNSQMIMLFFNPMLIF